MKNNNTGLIVLGTIISAVIVGFITDKMNEKQAKEDRKLVMESTKDFVKNAYSKPRFTTGEHVLYVEPESEAEEFIIKTIQPKCKDGIAVRLGAMWGSAYNGYVISDSDYWNNIDDISKLKGSD